MLTSAQRAFLNEVHYGVLGTLNHDQTVQQTLVWYVFEDECFRFSVGANSIKVRNIQRTGTATLTVVAGKHYCTVSGAAYVEPADVEFRRRLAERYINDPERVAAWMLRRPDAPRATLRLTIRNVYGQGV